MIEIKAQGSTGFNDARTAPYPNRAGTSLVTILPRSPARPVPCAALTLALCCVGPVQAQERPDPPEGSDVPVGILPTVVVSGSRSEQPQEDLPLSMDVLDATDLEDRQVSDIREAVRRTPNVSVRRAPARFAVTGAPNSTGRDGNAGFNIRGLGGDRVLILVDGIRQPRSYINGSNAFGRDTFSLGLLKRMEVVRGPSSVLYGSDGLAGLVNFITHEPADFLAGPGGEPRAWGGRVSGGWSGDDDGVTAAATIAGQAGSTAQWLLTGTAHRDRGLDTKGSNDSANVDRTTPNPQTTRDGSVLGKVVLRPDARQRHVLALEHAQRRSEVELLSSRVKPPLSASSVVAEDAEQTVRRNRLSWDARYALDAPWADEVRTLLGWQRAEAQDEGRTVRNDGGVRLRDTAYEERAFQAGVQASKTLPITSDWLQRLTVGMDFVRTEVTGWADGYDPPPLQPFLPRKYFPDTRETSTALYVQDEFVSDRWIITPGVRLERFELDADSGGGYSPPSPTPATSLSGSNVSPKFGLLYRVTPSWSVFGSYATGFRAPNAAQVNGFYENPTPTTFARLLSNPDLKPETSRSIELGMRGRSRRGSLEAAVFSSRFKDLIVDRKSLGGAGVAGDPLVFQSVNVDNATIRGFELSGHLDWGRLAGGWVSMPFAYGQARGKDRATGLPLNSIDPAKLVIGLQYERADWTWRLDATHLRAKNVDDLDSPYLARPVTPPRIRQLTVPSSTTLDLYAQWRIRRDLRANLAIGNLTDRKYWRWADVQGLAADSPAVDAYSQPGRYVLFSMVKDF